MNSIEVLTGQHIRIAYKPADIFQRILASFLDFIFQLIYIVTVLVIVFNGVDWMFPEDDFTITVLGIASIPYLLYSFIFEALMSGQTPGKMITKIRVTNVDGSVTGIGGYFLRWLLRPIDMIFSGGLGLFFIIFTEKHQRIGDMAAKTTVIKAAPEKVKFNQEFYIFGENYNPLFPQVEKLTEGQNKLIMDILSTPQQDEFEDDDDLRKLASKVKSICEITSSIDDREFLTRVAKDYNYFTTLNF